jgi:hypothetical protein
MPIVFILARKANDVVDGLCAEVSGGGPHHRHGHIRVGNVGTSGVAELQVCRTLGLESPGLPLPVRTRLELATCAVTALHEWVLHHLTRHAGSAKRRASHIRPQELGVKLWVRKSVVRPLSYEAALSCSTLTCSIQSTSFIFDFS